MAQLRGNISFSGQTIIWAGKWAFRFACETCVDVEHQIYLPLFLYSKEAFAAKDTGKFEFKATGSEVSAGTVLSFSGFFAIKKEGSDKKTKVKEEGVTVKFSQEGGGDDGKKLAGSGTGSNKFGDFTLAGKYDPETGRFMVSKVYKTDPAGGGSDEDGGSSSGSDDDDDEDGGNCGDEDDDVAGELADLKVRRRRCCRCC
jgi:hypothetical protein